MVEAITTDRVEDLATHILGKDQERREGGETTPTIGVFLGNAGGGKSLAAEWVRRLLVKEFGGDEELVVIIEDDDFSCDPRMVTGWFTSVFCGNVEARAWVQNYMVDAFIDHIMEPARCGQAVRYRRKNWATGQWGEWVTITKARIFLIVSRFPEQLAAYADIITWVDTPALKAMLWGVRRSLRGDLLPSNDPNGKPHRKRYYVHLLYWIPWAIKDLQLRRTEPWLLAHAILNRHKRQAIPAQLRVPVEA